LRALPSSDSIRSYWFAPSQKCDIRALATLPPLLTTNVPWKLRRLAASWIRISQPRTSRACAAGPPSLAASPPHAMGANARPAQINTNAEVARDAMYRV